MNKEKIDYKDIDVGIRNLVSVLNEIPFIATQASCEGHLRNSSGLRDIHPDDGHTFLDGGDIIFKVDRRYKLSRKFLKELKGISAKYPFVELHEHHCNTHGCYIEGSKVFYLCHTDLTRPESINGKDSLEQIVKKRHQVPIQAGERRLAEYKQVGSDVLLIAKKYNKLGD